MIDYYEILRLSPGASDEAIEEQYQFLLENLHPDQFGGGEADEHFIRAKEQIGLLNEAYEVLHDPSHRQEYDRQRNSAIEAARLSSEADPEPAPEESAPLQLASTPNEPSASPARSVKTRSGGWRDSVDAGLLAAFLAGVFIASGVLAVKYWHTGSFGEKSFVARFLHAAQQRQTARELAEKRHAGELAMVPRPVPVRPARSLGGRIADKGVGRVKLEPRQQLNEAADGLTGVVRQERPVKADIVLAKDQQAFGAEQVGNVEVYYVDGLQDCWTTKGNCGQPHVAANGLVGWTVYQPTKTGNYDFQPNGLLVLRRGGQIIQKINVAADHIVGWNFLDAGSKVVVHARASSGASVIARYESATGRLLESVDASRADLPPWALSVADR